MSKPQGAGSPRCTESASESPAVALVSLGCPKNLVDSEAMARILEDLGFRAAAEVRGADILVINTCGFLQEAAEESLERIADGLSFKREGAVRKVIVAGCLVQRLGERLTDEFPDLDGAVGTGSWHRIGEVCRMLLAGQERAVRIDPPGSGSLSTLRRRSSYGHFAYLKISEGCHRHCSYCVIPSIRGPLRSVPPDALVKEAEELARGGAAEFVLVGEDIGAYGRDMGEGWNLARLLRELNGASGVRWIRMLYVHPASVNRDLVAAAEECERVCSYIDMPIQHASSRVLTRMNRPTTRGDLERVLKMLKTSPKRFAIRTTVMVGFPGETDSDFEELRSFVKEWEFDHLGAFCYSPEGGTDAAGFSAQLDVAAKEDRRSEIMQLQSEISLKKNKAMVGSVAEVLVDVKRDDGLLQARTERQAPQVDGLTLVSGSGAARGEFLTVLLTGADVYDLHATPFRENRV